MIAGDDRPRPAELKKFRPIDNFRFAHALEETLEPGRDDRENIHTICPDQKRLFTLHGRQFLRVHRRIRPLRRVIHRDLDYWITFLEF